MINKSKPKKKRKGFTLVELLAVIVILGVIITIATMRVTQKVSKAKKDAFLLKANQVLSVAKHHEVENIDDLERTYIFPDDKTLSLKEYPDSGFLIRDSLGKYRIQIWDDNLKLCAVKDFDDDKITISNTINNKNKCISIDGEEVFEESDLASNEYQVIYHSNYPKGQAAYRQIFKKDLLTTLLDNQFTRDGYSFVNWNTKPDGSGTSFNNKAYKSNITTQKTGHLYAIWTPTRATLLKGDSFNSKIKTIANEKSMGTGTSDYLIKSISRVTDEPDESIKNSDHLVSASGTYSAYAWFEGDTGALKIWTNATLLVLPANAYRTFYALKELETIDLNGFSSSDTTSFRDFFAEDIKLSSIVGLDKLDTSNANYLETMFYGCSSITSLDLQTFNVEKVTTLENAFSNMTSLTSINITGWNLLNCSNFASMFYNDIGLETIDLRSLNGPKISSLAQMFNGCSNLKTIYLNNFKPVKATNFFRTFKDCTSLTTIYVHPDWDETLVNSNGDVFTNSTKIVGGSGTTFQGASSTYARIDDPTNNKPGHLTASTE